MSYSDEATLQFGGIVLRYGGFYGADNDALITPIRKRQIPIVGNGGGMFSWIHLDDAAAATVLALNHDGPAVFNIVDDEPARSATGYPCSPEPSAPSRRATCPLGWLARS